MVAVLIALWIGSAIAGWFFFWPWLVIPIVVVGFYMVRMAAGFRAARVRNGLPVGGSGKMGTSMVGPNIRLLMVTFVQHGAIFGIAAGIHWTLG